MEETVDYLTDNLEELKGNYICVSNVHTTMMSFRDKAYNVVQNSGAMALPDGKPLAIVLRCRAGAGTGFDAQDFSSFQRKGISSLLLRRF